MMKLITTNYALLYFLALVLICEIGLSTASSSSSSSSSSYAEEADEGFIRMKTSTLLGGLRDYKGNGNNNDAEIENLGRFAVQEHNKKENQLLEFGKVIKAKQQVVAGMMYHLTLEAVDAGKRKIFEAKVWVKPWMNFKQLQEFRHSDDDDSSTTSSEVVVEEDIHEAGWKKVPTHDSSVLEAAQYAIEAMQRRSNCLGRCFLPKLVLAKTKVIENGMKFYLVMKTKWHSRVETNKVMLTKNINGKFYKFEFL